MADNKCIIVKFKGYLKFVDLGLPSGTKWASMNVGATNPYEAGYYFSWGNVDGHAAGAGYDFSTANYSASTGASLTDNVPVSAAYDMARANFGPNSKLPTKEQFKELIDNCTSEWITINGVSGLKFRSSVNGNSIFIPASGSYDRTTLGDYGSIGRYWSSSYISTDYAYGLGFSSSNVNPLSGQGRRYGLTVRAVM